MEIKYMLKTKTRCPEITVIAGPNGSGKTTITKYMDNIDNYINADDIKQKYSCTDKEASDRAGALREYLLEKGEDFTFETVLSTDWNLTECLSTEYCLEEVIILGFFILYQMINSILSYMC